MGKIYTKLLFWLNRHRNLIFIIILGIGALYRFFGVTLTQEWFRDFGRDAIVAKHLVLYPETYNLTPLAASSAGTLNNTPVYYWILSIIWFFTRSETGLILFFAGMGVVTIYASYILSRKVFHGLYTLVFPLLISFSNLMIIASRNVWQPYFIPLLFLLVLTCLVNGFRGKAKYFFVAVELSFIATFIHLSFVPILLVIIVVVLVFSYRFASKKILVFLLGQVILNILLWLSFSPIGAVSSVDSFFSNLLISNNGIEKYFTNIYSNTLVLKKHLLPILSPHLFVTISLLTLINIVLTVSRSNFDKTFGGLLLIIAGSFFSLGAYHEKLGAHYLLSYHILFLLIFSLLVQYLGKYSRILAILAVLVLYLGISLENVSIKHSISKTSEIEISEAFAREILALPNTNRLLTICFTANYPCYADTIDPGLWYSLEKISGKKLGYTQRGSENYLPITDPGLPTQKYLICRYESSLCLKDSRIDDNSVVELKHFSTPETTLFRMIAK